MTAIHMTCAASVKYKSCGTGYYSDRIKNPDGKHPISKECSGKPLYVKDIWEPDPKAVCQHMASNTHSQKPQILLHRKSLYLFKVV